MVDDVNQIENIMPIDDVCEARVKMVNRLGCLLIKPKKRIALNDHCLLWI